ncbi:MAG: prolyl-tRNA synthetase associated domain-containing protein [Tenericutes bacterium]|nr:prolyl-tRNA synthetase associated domain-containing protein [Mycoplasmatota bacterium]
MTKEEVYKKLNELNIEYRVVNHKAVFTMEDVINENIEPFENIVKNIFIRDDKKINYYLVLVSHNKKVNLKELRNKLNSRPLTLASEEDLYKYLGLTKGSVSPLGILNDKDHIVSIIIDEDIKNISEIGVHPNINTATVFLKPKDLEIIFKNNKYEYIEL